jgi:hypothetical protein
MVNNVVDESIINVITETINDCRVDQYSAINYIT